MTGFCIRQLKRIQEISESVKIQNIIAIIIIMMTTYVSLLRISSLAVYRCVLIIVTINTTRRVPPMHLW